MNEIEKLNERITQLSVAIKTGSEAIKSMEVALKAAEEERDRLADQRREQEPKFERVHQTKPYWRLAFDNAFGCGAWVFKQVERGWYDFNNMTDFEGNNYFHTEQRAQEVADKINLLLKLERLHDTFCPDYVPDWNDKDKVKYYVFKNEFVSISIWDIGYVSTSDISDVYFPTEEIAKKVCDILNAEERSKDK